MAELPPNPSMYSNPQQWQQKLYEYLLSQTRVQEENNPLPVQLLHQTSGQMERASVAGTVMYNPTQKSVVYSEDGLWKELGMDYDIFYAEQRVLADFEDVVSVTQKAKPLNKFGANLSVGTTFETVAVMQGATSNETFVTTNIIDSIVSSSVSDTTQTIAVEGHTVDGSGNMTFVVQEAALNGRTEVTLATPLARCTRLRVKQTGTFGTAPSPLVGTVYVYDNTDGITAGVPNTPAATKAILDIGATSTQKCSTTISATDYYFITAFDAGIGVAGGPADRVFFQLEIRDIFNGGAWIPTGRPLTVEVNQNGVQKEEKPYLIVPKNHDVRVVARTNASTASVFAELRGYLAGVVT